MKVSAHRVVGISVSQEFLEYCIGRDPITVLNSWEFFPRIIEKAREADPDPEFVVESAEGFESGIVHALQKARLRVSIVESGDIQQHCGLADAVEVDALVVARYAAEMREKLEPAPRVQRILTAYAGRPRESASMWQRLNGWVKGLKRTP